MQNSEKTYLKIADLCIEADINFQFTRQQCVEYALKNPKAPDVYAAASQKQIAEEKAICGKAFSDAYFESVCLYRSIAEQLPLFDRVVFHSAAVEVEGKGYLFTAPSGTGKTTHIKLWLENYGDKVSIINGDKPILGVSDGEVTVYSTPWAGKEGLQRNSQAPVAAICLLRRAKENKITQIKPGEHFEEMIKQFYLPKDPISRLKTLEIVDIILKRIPLYLLECDISSEAAKTSFEALTVK